MTERELQQKVIALCAERGLYWHHEADSRRGNAGWPDLVIIGPFSALFVELKSADGRRSRLQIEVAARMVSAGLIYRLWRPEHLLSGKIAQVLDGMLV